MYNYIIYPLYFLAFKHIIGKKMTINQRLAKLKEKGIKQVDIVKVCLEKGVETIPSMVNNVIHNRNTKGEKTIKIRSVIIELLDNPDLSDSFWN